MKHKSCGRCSHSPSPPPYIPSNLFRWFAFIVPCNSTMYSGSIVHAPVSSICINFRSDAYERFSFDFSVQHFSGTHFWTPTQIKQFEYSLKRYCVLLLLLLLLSRSALDHFTSRYTAHIRASSVNQNEFFDSILCVCVFASHFQVFSVTTETTRWSGVVARVSFLFICVCMRSSCVVGWPYHDRRMG